MTEEIKTLADYNEGDEFRGDKIKRLYSAKKDYLIYVAEGSDEVIVATDDKTLRRRCAEIATRISIITEYLVTKSERKKYRDQIGLAYSEAIEGNIEQARNICDKIIERVELHKENLGKFYYLVSCLAVVMIAAIISYVLKRFDLLTEISTQFSIMTYAAVGGFLSIAKDIRKIRIESHDFGWFQVFYGTTRIVISMLSGLIVFILIKSEIILPSLGEQSNVYVLRILAIVAGFSETMIPNLLKRIEDEKLISKKDKEEEKEAKNRKVEIPEEIIGKDNDKVEVKEEKKEHPQN